MECKIEVGFIFRQGNIGEGALFLEKGVSGGVYPLVGESDAGVGGAIGVNLDAGSGNAAFAGVFPEVDAVDVAVGNPKPSVVAVSVGVDGVGCAEYGLSGRTEPREQEGVGLGGSVVVAELFGAVVLNNALLVWQQQHLQGGVVFLGQRRMVGKGQ